jgi:uncharacterized protein (TIGR03545 family)
MNDIQNNTSSTPKIKTKKKPGIIRWNAIIPLTIFLLINFIYFHFFFDGHMKSLIEWAGYKALGAELNIAEFKSSFANGSVEINKIELTNKEQPQFNSIELSHLKFDVNIDALLRLKFVVDTMNAEGIQFSSKRKSQGKVAPPEPIDPNEPSFTDQLQKNALNKLEKDNKANLIGDIAVFLKNGDINSQLKGFEGQIASKKMAEDMNAKWNKKRTDWDQNIKSLPNQNEVNAIKDRAGKIKYKDFKSIDELNASVNEFNSIKKDVETKVQVVNETKTKLTADVTDIQNDYKNLEKQIKEDVDTVKSKFKIPKLDAGQFAKALFMNYLTPYTQKLDRFKTMAEKYLPPKYSKMVTAKIDGTQDKLSGKKVKVAARTDEDIDDTIQPHPRAHGISYEFPITTGYPLFWIKNITISSKSNAQADFGDLAGTITNVTSNQRQINKQTELKLAGDFKSMNIHGIKAFAAFNNIKAVPEIAFNFDIASYPLADLALSQSEDVSIKIPTSQNTLSIDGKTIGFKNYDIKFRNEFKDVKFELAAKDKTVSDILGSTFGAIGSFDVNATARGPISDLAMDINSSLGAKLEAAFSGLLQKKLDEVNKLVKEKIDQEVNKQKEQLNGQISKLTGGYLTDINKAQSQLDDQKKVAEDKINIAKKDLENKAKNKVQEEGKKAIDDLKKKFGF